MYSSTRMGEWAVVCALLSGCGAGDPSGRDDATSGEAENIGEAVFELMTIPTGVGCVRLTVTGSSTVVKDFSLAAGASTATLNMDRLPLGNVVVSGEAYATTCGTGSTLYVGDPAAATLKAGLISNIALTFRKNNPVSASVNFVGNVQAISAQNAVTYALIDGNVFWWGYNSASGTTSMVPTAFTGLTGVTELSQSSAGDTGCAVKTDGTLWCWGANDLKQGGQPTPPFTLTAPTKVGTETTWSMAGSGTTMSCGAHQLSKLIKCFGSDYLGNGVISTSATPVSVVALAPGGFRSLSVGGSHACVVGGTMDVRCWGSNGFGQLGDGTTTARLSAGGVGLAPARQVVTGFGHSCVAMQDGTARCAGDNSLGALGDGTTTNRLTFTPVSGLSGVDKLAAGRSHNCVLLTNGSVKCWGWNAAGQLGDGSVTTRTTPVAVAVPGTVVLLSAGANHNCAVTDVRDIYCWGENVYGALGDGTYVGSPVPVKVKLP